MDAKKAVERDWSSLLPEILNLIAKNLIEISDFVRFCAVCTSWRLHTDLPPLFPWILEKRRYPYESHILFYSITFSKIYKFRTPKYFGKRFFGSSQGYILTELCDRTKTHFYSAQHTCQISLLNPINNHEIPLPACNFGYYPIWIGPQQFQIGKYVVCFGYIGCGFWKKAFYCFDQDKWCEFKLDYDDFKCFYLNSMLFGIELDTGVTKVTDMATGTLAYVIPPIEDYVVKGDLYLVYASGEIILVFQRYDSPKKLCNYLFDVHRLDLSSSPCWVKVDKIGNQALFIDIDGGIALEASDFSGIKANCIYYIEPGSSVKRIDIKTSNQELLQCPLKEPERWFVPNLKHLQAQ